MDVRDLPSVDSLVRELASDLPREITLGVARAAISEARAELLAGKSADAVARARSSITRLENSRPQAVLNATGVLLHTNLGRSPLHPEAAELARSTAVGYSNLELQLESGKRGGRKAYITDLLKIITGAEAATVVNNNAAALFLTLSAFAAGRQVPVSRGELIEIGGSYRLPDLMAATGTTLVEVGTTNRTRIADHRDAVSEATALLLKVHPSNYRIAGFSEEPSLSEMVDLARKHEIPCVFDIGSGLIDETTPWLSGPPPAWLGGEPGVRQSIEAGADLVMFSGDKLFGGPQAGIIVGSADLIQRLDKHPITRALRIDGPTLNALTLTAEMYADGRAGQLPFWEMASQSTETLEGRCQSVIGRSSLDATVVDADSTVGAGSVPGSQVPSRVIAVSGSDIDRLYLELLHGKTPVVGRREGGRLLLDLRSVDPGSDQALAEALEGAISRCRS